MLLGGASRPPGLRSTCTRHTVHEHIGLHDRDTAFRLKHVKRRQLVVLVGD